MKSKTWSYVVLIVVFLAMVWGLVALGTRIYPATAEAPVVRSTASEHVAPIVTLLVQVSVILIAGRALGYVCRMIGQPQVVGEMIAGIILGPSLFGWLSPEAFAWVFPEESKPFLGLLSQLGVILFLFLIGLELDPKLLRNRGHAAVMISHASIAFPFVLGVGLTLYLFPKFFGGMQEMEFTPVALFMGAAMSVTAFPVLARMLTERNLHRTDIGAIAITAAAVDDATAWCMLAAVIGIARADGLGPGLTTATLAIVYVVAMFTLVRPLLRRLQRIYEHRGRLSQGIVGVVFIMLLGSAWITEQIGIHALFGAFMMGAMMPKGTQFVRMLSEKLEDFTVTFLLPIFFANAGLKTQIGLLDSPSLWMHTVLIIGVACIGKFGGSTIAGRVSGLSWRDSSVIGVLMNTRGLMELVILEIGLQEGVLTPTVYAMMVLMALATTAMTSPLLSLIAPKSSMPSPRTGTSSGFDVLIPVAAPESGPALARVAAGIIGTNSGDAGKLLALHLVKPQIEQFGGGLDELEFERDESLTPILSESRQLRLGTETISFPTRDIAGDITAVAKGRSASLILMGFHKPVFGTEILGGVVHQVLQQSPANLAVFVDRGIQKLERVLVALIGSKHDMLALSLAERMNRLSKTAVTILHIVPPNRGPAEKLEAQQSVDRVFTDKSGRQGVTLKVVIEDFPVDAVLRECAGNDLLILGVDESWGLESHLFGWRPQRIADESPISLLVVRKAT